MLPAESCLAKQAFTAGNLLQIPVSWHQNKVWKTKENNRWGGGGGRGNMKYCWNITLKNCYKQQHSKSWAERMRTVLTLRLSSKWTKTDVARSIKYSNIGALNANKNLVHDAFKCCINWVHFAPFDFHFFSKLLLSLQCEKANESVYRAILSFYILVKIKNSSDARRWKLSQPKNHWGEITERIWAAANIP